MSALKLRYVFSTTPNPIRASPEELNPNVISLAIVISNPSTFSVAVDSIQIKIPTGENTARAISAAPDLPGPQYDTNGPWEIATQGSIITITPKNPSANAVTQPITFTLPDITVNEVEGTVPVTISEIAPTRITDDTTYELVKLPSDFPVTQLYAQPAVLDDIDQTVTIFWSGTDEVAYSLHSPGWSPKPNCVSDGDCLTAADGRAGVQSDVVRQSTTFSLDVVKTETSGRRTVIATLPLTVSVLVPTILQQSSVNVVMSSVLSAHVVALNSDGVDVLLGSKKLAEGLPPDTYAMGYAIAAELGKRATPVTLQAYSHASTARATQAVAPVSLTPPAILELGDDTGPSALAVTPDGETVCVCNAYASSVAVVSGNGTSLSTVIGDVSSPSAIAITPDGKRAYVCLSRLAKLAIIDLESRTLDAAQIGVGNGPSGIVITADGTTAYVANRLDGTIAVVDLASATVTKTIAGVAAPAALALGGTHLLAASATMPGLVTVVAVATGVVVATVALGTPAADVVVSPDGTTAYAALPEHGAIAAIDLATFAVTARIDGLVTPVALGQSPDGHVLLAASRAALATVSFIDTATRRIVNRLSPGGTGVSALATTGDGTAAYLASAGDNRLYTLA